MIAALLEDDQPATERRDAPADLVVDLGGEREIADRVEPVRIEAEETTTMEPGASASASIARSVASR